LWSGAIEDVVKDHLHDGYLVARQDLCGSPPLQRDQAFAIDTTEHLKHLLPCMELGQKTQGLCAQMPVEIFDLDRQCVARPVLVEVR